MPDPLTDPDDDALAAALADAWIERAASDPVIRREALRAAGLIQEPETLPALARQHGMSEGTVRHICRMFRARLAAEILKDPAAPLALTDLAARTLRER